ncbi:hypothetical protein PV08_07436 [Exophiala spinifera]|uniref:Uncharacterized protein n=1 Tax=Exophiala spinifera TaxID=91928 RepID=A0A0D1ZPB7_9EURO|nr:uncharacterized protein PV08_07436 [Exophiala spinifera]KIW14652.1 hypothetical protein PV08_07436 [Exophiala spinifera]
MSCMSRPVFSDGPRAVQPAYRRASDPESSTTTNRNPVSQQPSCSGDYYHKCYCGCKGCGCHTSPITDEANHHRRNSQKGRAIPIPENPVTVLPWAPSSLSTIHSNDQKFSFDNSFEVGDTYLQAADVAQHEVDSTIEHDEDDDPWTTGQYLSRPDDIELENSSNMIGAEDMEYASMYVEAGGPSSAEDSMLSSQYEASFRRSSGSVTTSQLINGIGDAFASQLPQSAAATMECQHTKTRQMCQVCRHY